jgi:hydroxyquinol 1,2-dioxygenase
MREFDEQSVTQAVIARLADCQDPRFAHIMTALVTHLHDFVREVKLTESEWFTAVQFLTDVGKACTDKRQEFILLSDTLGVSVLVITLNHPAHEGSVESTVQGPFYWEGAPELPRGSNLAEGGEGRTGLLFRTRARHRRPPAGECPAGHLVGRWRRQLRHADPRRDGHEGTRPDSYR